MLLLPTPDFGQFFIVAVNFFNLGRSASTCIGMWTLRRSLGAIVTKMPLFFESEALACFHELRSFVCVDLSGSGPAGHGINGIRVATPFVIPSRFPLFWGLQLLAWFLSDISHLQAYG